MLFSDDNPQSQPLSALARNCAQQTLQFFHRVESDMRYCFEIFRRAIVEKDEQAWALLQDLYQDQLVRWVRRHPCYSACRENEAYFTNRALEKFWQALAPAQFARFPDLPHLLSYLQLCVNSAVQEHMRARRRARYEVDLAEADGPLGEPVDAAAAAAASAMAATSAAAKTEVEEDLLARRQGQELWHIVAARLNDPKEIHAAYDSFLLDLKPAEIFERHPGMYANTREIYRIKENILGRLRRDSELLDWAGLTPESR